MEGPKKNQSSGVVGTYNPKEGEPLGEFNRAPASRFPFPASSLYTTARLTASELGDDHVKGWEGEGCNDEQSWFRVKIEFINARESLSKLRGEVDVGLDRLDLAIKYMEGQSVSSKTGGDCDCGLARGDNTKNSAAQPKKVYMGRHKLFHEKVSQPVKTYFRKKTARPFFDSGLEYGPASKALFVQDFSVWESGARHLEKGVDSDARLKPIGAPDFSTGGPIAPVGVAGKPVCSASRSLPCAREDHVVSTLLIDSTPSAEAPTKVALSNKGSARKISASWCSGRRFDGGLHYQGNVDYGVKRSSFGFSG